MSTAQGPSRRARQLLAATRDASGSVEPRLTESCCGPELAQLPRSRLGGGEKRSWLKITKWAGDAPLPGGEPTTLAKSPSHG